MNTKRTAFALFAALSVAGALLPGCGKDRTLDEYQDDKIRDDYEKMRAVAGVYSGLLVSRLDNQPIGLLTVVAKPDMQVNPSTTATDHKAVLRLEIQLQSPDRILSATFGGGAFDATAKSFVAQSAVAMPAGSPSLTMSLSGSFSGDTLRGELYDLGYYASGSDFALKKDAALDPVQVLKTIRLSATEARVQTAITTSFRGKARLPGGTSDTPVALSFLRPIQGSEQQLTDLLLPTKTLDVGVNINNGDISFTFPNSLWDQRYGTLQGEASGNSGSMPYKIALRCQEATRAGVAGWSCRWTAASGQSFAFEVYDSGRIER